MSLNLLKSTQGPSSRGAHMQVQGTGPLQDALCWGSLLRTSTCGWLAALQPGQ